MRVENFGSLLAERGPIAIEDRSEEWRPDPPTLAEASPLIKKVADLIKDSVVLVLAENHDAALNSVAATAIESSDPAAESSDTAAEEARKTCSRCDTLKPLEAFHVHKAKAHGRDSVCRGCKSLARSARYREHAAEEAAAATEWKRKNPIRARVQRLKHYAATRGRDGEKGDLSADEWETILEAYRETRPDGSRGRYRCAYCARRASRIDLTIDHVLALSRGGRNTRTNVVPACGACNAGKRDRERRPTLPSPHLLPEDVGDAWEPDDELPEGALSFP